MSYCNQEIIVKKVYLLGLALMGSLGALLPAKAMAQSNCVNLQEVTTGQTQIRKQIRVGFLGPGNMHTDFSVPPNSGLTFYEVSFIPENRARYDAQVNFRYSSGAQATVFSSGGDVAPNQVYSRWFVSPTGELPFLINTSVSGENNTAYTISVRGCRDM